MRLMLWISLLLSVCFVACNNSTKDVTLTKVDASSSSNKNRSKAKKQSALVTTDNMRDKSAYENIKGNVPRLKAMLSGRFVQYNTNADPERKAYSPWYVNEGKDSVVLYVIPVGEATRQGHWMYLYQIMTSLPNDPIYVAFAKLEEINRDSIVSTYYEQPEEFKYSLDDILMDPSGTFKEFNFNALRLSKIGEIVWYERETPLKYIGRSQWMDTKSENKEIDGGFNRDYYVVTPANYHFGKEYYKPDKKLIGRSRGERLMKYAMLSEEYNGR